MVSQGHPQGHLKSCKILLDPSRDPSVEVFAPRSEKSVARALPGTTPYVSRTVPAMVLACSRRRVRTFFFITLGSHLAPFSPQWASQWGPGAKKGPPPKTSKKTPIHKSPGVSEMLRDVTPEIHSRHGLLRVFWCLGANLVPAGPRDPISIDSGAPNLKKHTKNT